MGTSSPKACARKSPVTSLLYAVSEWLLIFMLFLDSIFSFFITKFARLWKLCTPCLLCSRLDHVFGSEKKGYLWKLICGKHKLEISSLVLCHAHNKLVNVHEMCNSCLCSFATIQKSNSETYRLLVGKLREDPHPASQRLCSCCKVPYVPRGFVQTLIQTRSSGWETEDLNVPLSSSVSRNPLPHVQCRELKITSDTVSDGDGCISKDDIGVRMEADFISVAGDLTTTKLVEPALTPEPLVLLTDTPPPVECDVLIGHGLDELTPKHVENNAVFSSSTDLLALDNVVPSSNTIATSVKALEGSYVTRGEEYEMKRKETEKTGILATKVTSEAPSEAQSVSSEAVQIAPNVLELGDAYKLALGARGLRQMSGRLSQQWIGKESSKETEDLKLLLTQLSFNRMNDQSRDMSPRMSVYGDESRSSDVSSAAGIQILQRRFSLERNEFSLESLDAFNVSEISEIEGDNMVEQLKRKIEYDKKLMNSLYKELEEERSASAIAANQAMAMITRLQEEKASLHMEALQCIRMMEEQSEYDDDALQKANDLITEKDKKMQDFEAELEFYRMNFPNAYTIDNLVETSNVKERDIGVVHLESNQIGTTGYDNSVAGKPDIHEKVGNEGSTYNKFLLEFEDEKLGIMQCLEKLENMLHLFSNNGVKIDLFSNEPKHVDDHLPSLARPTFGKESGELDCVDRNSVLATGMADFTSLRSEMANLNKRMEMLEADKNFLENTINSLRKGEDGLRFVQEIASHLRELRKVGIRS
ncbi:Myosin-binding protein 1, partial [Cucurbita argyrosperma subsp. argyrosperma]